MSESLSFWFERHTRLLLVMLAAVAVILRIVLGTNSPQPFGYIYDAYWPSVELVYETRTIPSATACRECYQPPFFQFVSVPFYAIGRWIAPTEPSPYVTAMRSMQIVPLAASLITLWYCYRLLRLFRFRGPYLVTGVAVAASLPVFFIASYSLEPDLLLGTVIAAFLYYLVRWYIRPAAARVGDVVRLGCLAGLAAATKYSGLSAGAVGLALFGLEVANGPSRRRAAAHLALFVLALVSIGSWKYVKNLQQFGTPFFANGSAADGFSGTGRQTYWNSYEFGTLRVDELLQLTRQSAPSGKLTELPVYRSFWTTLHGLMWGDMGFFTNPTRHGSGRPLYRDRHVPQWLTSSVLSLGFVPSALAAIGLLTMLTHRSSRPLVLICAVGLTSYVYWVVGQQFWAIKAKYLLFLLPAYVVFLTAGLSLLTRVLPTPFKGLVWLSVLALIVLAHGYLLAFAWG